MTGFLDDHGIQRDPFDVFISYSKEDHAKVSLIAKKLRDQGFSVFWDKEIPPGVSYPDFIGQMLNLSRTVLVCWSPASVRSQWVISEAEYARESKRLVACQIEPATVGPPFNTFQRADLTDWSGDSRSEAWLSVTDLIKHRARPAAAESSNAATQRVPASTTPSHSGRSEAAPVTEQSRIKTLDVMRGFAVLGILIVNAAFFAAPWQTSQNPLLPPLDVNDQTMWSWFVMHVFFEFKCITLFSLLFGASIYMVGGERSDKARGGILRARLFWLLVFGLIHALLIWYGDILVTYALTGFLVLLARSWKPVTLLTVGIILYLVSLSTQAMFGMFEQYIPAETIAEMEAQMHAPSAETMNEVIAAYQGGLISATSQNITTWTEFIFAALIGLIIRTAGVMMIGLALFKLGFLSGKSPVWVYILFLATGVLAISAIAYQALLNWDAGFDFSHMMSRGVLPNAGLSILGTLGYISLFVLLVKAGTRFITEPLAAVGRMAFTNYITQSIIMTTIFWSGRGFGLYGEVDRPTLIAIVVAIWALQLIWSPLWLSRFEMGPLEWMWRRLSYGKPVQIARPAVA